MKKEAELEVVPKAALREKLKVESWKTEDRRPETEDRGPKTGDRRPETGEARS
jgi:hypothetical protein